MSDPFRTETGDSEFDGVRPPDVEVFKGHTPEHVYVLQHIFVLEQRVKILSTRNVKNDIRVAAVEASIRMIERIQADLQATSSRLTNLESSVKPVVEMGNTVKISWKTFAAIGGIIYAMVLFFDKVKGWFK